MIRQEGGWQHVGDVVLRIVDKLEANQITHLETKRGADRRRVALCLIHNTEME